MVSLMQRRREMMKTAQADSFTPVSYVETTGANWIDTGIVLQSDMLFELRWMSLSGIASADRLGDDQCFLNRVNNNYTNNSKMFGVGFSPYIKPNVIRKLTIDCANGTANNNVSNALTVNAPFIQPTETFLIGSNYPGHSSYANHPDLIRFYELTITQNGAVTKHFIPGIDAHGAACIQEELTKQLIYPSGTGAFAYA